MRVNHTEDQGDPSRRKTHARLKDECVGSSHFQRFLKLLDLGMDPVRSKKSGKWLVCGSGQHETLLSAKHLQMWRFRPCRFAHKRSTFEVRNVRATVQQSSTLCWVSSLLQPVPL